MGVSPKYSLCFFESDEIRLGKTYLQASGDYTHSYPRVEAVRIQRVALSDRVFWIECGYLSLGTKRVRVYDRHGTSIKKIWPFKKKHFMALALLSLSMTTTSPVCGATKKLYQDFACCGDSGNVAVCVAPSFDAGAFGSRLDALENSLARSSVFENVQKVDAVLERTMHFMHHINAETLQSDVDTLASTEYGGREMGTRFENKTVDFIASRFQGLGLRSVLKDKGYIQRYRLDDGRQVANVLASVEGSVFPDEYILITGHHDHLGQLKDENGTVVGYYPGANDNAGGAALVMQFAKTAKRMCDAGHCPLRSLVFMAVGGEEQGLFGSELFARAPPFPLSGIKFVVNADMLLGTNAEEQANANSEDSNYLFSIGTAYATGAAALLNAVNAKTSQTTLSSYYTKGFGAGQVLFYRSDHWTFAQRGIPSTFFFGGTSETYHEVTDTADTVDTLMGAKRGQLVFQFANVLANIPTVPTFASSTAYLTSSHTYDWNYAAMSAASPAGIGSVADSTFLAYHKFEQWWTTELHTPLPGAHPIMLALSLAPIGSGAFGPDSEFLCYEPASEGAMVAGDGTCDGVETPTLSPIVDTSRMCRVQCTIEYLLWREWLIPAGTGNRPPVRRSMLDRPSVLEVEGPMPFAKVRKPVMYSMQQLP